MDIEIVLLIFVALIAIPISISLFGNLVETIKNNAPSTIALNKELEQKIEEQKKSKEEADEQLKRKIFEVEERASETAAELAKEDTRISNRLRQLLQFEKDLNEREANIAKAFEQNKKLFYTVDKTNRNINESLYQVFDKTTVDRLCNTSDEQKIIRGLESDFTVLHSEVRFLIESDNDKYETSLSSCTCKSYKFGHGEPCKHMIWLGSRLGIFMVRERMLVKRESALVDKELSISMDLSDLAKRKEVFSAKEASLKEKEQELNKKALEDERTLRKKELLMKQEAEELENIRNLCFDQSQNYPWLADFVYRLNVETDSHRLNRLHELRASKSAEILKAIRSEKNAAIYELNLLKNQIAVYESLFPWLEEFRTVSVDEAVQYVRAASTTEDYTAAARKWLSPEEFAELTPTEKNQLALDRYMKRNKTDWEIGIEYERYVGYLYEQEGYTVKYTGATQGLEDMGRDLIAEKSGTVLVIQCKRWSAEKIIHEKHIFQLFGTTVSMRVSNPRKNYTPVFYTSAHLSDVAVKCADELGIEVHQSIPLDSYPVIKCNIGHDSQGTPEKIYHLPFDQQYDRIVIEPNKGEFYAHTIQEAESAGFRHAYKWHSE